MKHGDRADSLPRQNLSGRSALACFLFRALTSIELWSGRSCCYNNQVGTNHIMVHLPFIRISPASVVLPLPLLQPLAMRKGDRFRQSCSPTVDLTASLINLLLAQTPREAHWIPNKLLVWARLPDCASPLHGIQLTAIFTGDRQQHPSFHRPQVPHIYATDLVLDTNPASRLRILARGRSWDGHLSSHHLLVMCIWLDTGGCCWSRFAVARLSQQAPVTSSCRLCSQGLGPSQARFI